MTARGLLRNHHGGHAAVSNLELFFDLVYAFAITQIAGFVRAHLSLEGVTEGIVLFLAVWWVWMYTSWATNWANPDTVPVRLMIVVTMLASLVLATVLPRTFGDAHYAMAFALTYCAIQIGRTLFVAWAMAGEQPAGARNMGRIAAWFAASTPLWLAGVLVASPSLHIALWAGALAIEYTGPFAFFRVPGMGRSTPGDWDISGSHMAERASQFVLIAMGEGIVETGATVSQAEPSPARIFAFVACFAGSVLMWWIYFDTGAARGARRIAQSAEAGRIARNAYTYLHMPIIASVIATAVADALLLAAPGATASTALIAACGGGLVVFLAAMALFKRQSSPRGNIPLSHLVGLGLLIVLIAAAQVFGWPGTVFTGLCGAALLVVAVWEWGSFHGGWQERMARHGALAP